MLIEELARAKVNLTLQVLGRRPDGYHELASVIAFSSIADVIVLDTAHTPTVSVSGPFAPQLPSEVLITRTLQVLHEREPQLRLGSVHLDKRLPVAAGIGGGSADAAAVLRAVRSANPELADVVDWLAIAATLGADVPVCMANQLAYMTGMGEHVSHMAPLSEPLHAILINSLAQVPDNKTAQVFRALAKPAKSADPTPSPPRLTTSADVYAAVADLGNDLEKPAQTVMPFIADVLAVLRAQPGCHVARMSGAGPTCFGLFDDTDAALKAIQAAYPAWWVQAVTLS